MANSPVTVAEIQIEMSYKTKGDPQKQINKTIQSFQNVGAESERATKSGNKLFASLKKIATYRLLRTTLKTVVSALGEGIKNLTEWSKLTDGRFAASMEKMQGAFTRIKNSLAVAIAPLIENVLTPLFTKLADIFVAVSDKISMFIARLKGETKYLSVATGATKKYEAAQRSLLGFDELNKLSGGNNGSDYSGMFQYKDVGVNNEPFLFNLKLKLGGFDVLKGGLDGNEIIRKVLYHLTSLAGGIIGFDLGGFGGAVVGTIFGITLATIFTGLSPFEASGNAEKGEVVAGWLTDVLGILCGAMGWGVGGIGGALILGTAGMTLGLLIENMDKVKDLTGMTDTQFAELVKNGLLGMLGTAMSLVVLAGGGSKILALTIGISLTLAVKKISTDINDKVSKGIFDIKDDNIILSPSQMNQKQTPLSTVLKNALGFANGGFPQQGTMFIAGEAGAEFVGNIGGRTGVYNTDQMAGALASANVGVENAVYQMASAIVNAINSQPVPSIKIGDREIYQASERGRRTIGGSLVQGA